MTSPGYVEFTLAGQALRLEPVFDGADAHELFFIFGDQTNGLETYPSGRFLYAALPESGQVVLDFNKAENLRARSRRSPRVRCRPSRTACRCESKPAS